MTRRKKSVADMLHERDETARRNGTPLSDNPELARSLLEFARDCQFEGDGPSAVLARVRQRNLDIGHPPLPNAQADRIAAMPFRDEPDRRNGDNIAKEAADPGPWVPPMRLGGSLTTPVFPCELLPGPLATWVIGEAEATQTPPDLAAMLALAICGAGLASKFRVRVREGWGEPLNLFTVTAMLPGERKSAVFSDAMVPVQAFEKEEQERMSPIIAEAATEHRVLEARLKHAETQAGKATDPEKLEALRGEAKRLAKELAVHCVPEMPELFCDDITPEKLSNLLATQGGRMLQAAAEGTAFEIAKGRYSETANFDVYLKGHAGDPLRTGRMSRPGESVAQPALSCAFAVQPDVIRGLADQATMRGRGFLARFLYGIPTSLVGCRRIKPTPVPAAVARAYSDTVISLWRLPGATDEQGRLAPNWLQFSTGADDALQDLERWLEPQLGENGELFCLAGWASKLAGAVARIAGILHMVQAVSEDTPWNAAIGVETIEAAICLGRDYLLPHAQAAFAMMGADQRLLDAVVVANWLCRNSEYSEDSEYRGTVSKRDIHQAHRGRFKTADDVDPILKLLVEHGFLRPIPQPRRSCAGQPPSPRFAVNPLAITSATETTPPTQNSQNPQNSGDMPNSEDSENSESPPSPANEEEGHVP